MKTTITIEVDDYREAKYILGAAALLQSIEDNQVADTYANVPVAAVLMRTVNLAAIWLEEAKSEDSGLLVDDIFNVDDEMSVENWAIAFRRMDIARETFMGLVNSEERYLERYRKIMNMEC